MGNWYNKPRVKTEDIFQPIINSYTLTAPAENLFKREEVFMKTSKQWRV